LASETALACPVARECHDTVFAVIVSLAAQHQKQIEALTVGLQKVGAQLEVSKAAPQTVLNNQ
jgi:hypothetical protein